MRRAAVFVPALLSLASCSIPVLRSDLLDQGIRDASMTRLTESPQLHKGKLFILGGAIVSTRLTETGSLIEAIHIPADSAGYLKEAQATTGRFLALYPRDPGVLDPVFYCSPYFGGCAFRPSSISASIPRISDFISATAAILSARKGASIVTGLVIENSP